MLASSIASVDQSLSTLARDVGCVREASWAASDAARADAICAALRSADALTAVAVELLGRGGVEAATSLPAEMLLGLSARRMGSEARMLTGAACELRAMPALAAAFSDGTVSWGQVRAIVAAVSRLPAPARVEIDAVIGDHALALCDADPDRLVQIVDDEVARRRADLALAREDRAFEGSFLAIQGRLDGGACFYGEADSESAATLVEALDAAAGAPKHPDLGESRARQRFDALIGICEASLAGGHTSGRPRPRLLATLDLAELGGDAKDDAMRLLWSLAGRPARLTCVAAEAMLCDPTIVPVVFDGAQPVAVGDAATPVSGEMRTALVARDGGCRFPGCGAPAGWTDAHHVIAGRGRTVTDLMLLCRRCHRRVHRFAWRIRLRGDGVIEFTRRGRTYTSLPRHRSPPARK
jgi:hypothetical protein